MVINGAARAAPWQLAKHLERTDHNESVNVLDIWGIDAPDLKSALYEMHCLGAGARSRRTLYHANIDPREDERLTEEQRKTTVSRLADKLGLAEQPYVLVQHVKNGREHFHVVWSRIDLDSMTAIHDGHNYRKHEEVAHELEKEFGHEHTKRVHIRDKEKEIRPTPAPSFAEYLQAERSGIDPKEAKRQITECWRQTTTGYDFRYRLEAEGYTLARGDRKDFVLIDKAGEIHGLTGRRIAGVKAHEIRERMADIDPETLDSVAEAQRLLRLKWQQQNEVAAKEFTSASERLRAEDLERQREAQGGLRPRLNHNDQDIADAVWKLNQTMGTQVAATIVGKPTPEQIQQFKAELDARPEMAAQPVRSADRHTAAQPEATAGGEREAGTKPPKVAATPIAEPSPEASQRPSVEVENSKATPIPTSEDKTQPSRSFWNKAVGWLTGRREEAPRPVIDESLSRSVIPEPADAIENSSTLPIPAAEPRQRPSASLFVKVFGWLIDAYQRAIDRAAVHEVEKIAPGQERLRLADQQPKARQADGSRRLPDPPPAPAAPHPSPARPSLVEQANDLLAQRSPDEIAQAAQRLREQEERQRRQHERELMPED